MRKLLHIFIVLLFPSLLFGQDTLIVNENTIQINEGGNKYKMIIGFPDIYKDSTGILKIGTYKPLPDIQGTYLWTIKEDLTIRASKNPAGYKIEKGNKYLEFLFANNSFKTINVASLDSIHRGFQWTIADGSYFKFTVSKGRLKEEIKSISKRNKFNFIINTNLVNIGNKFERFKIMDFVTIDSIGKELPTTFTITTSNDSLFGQALVDTAGAAFPIYVDPSFIDTTLEHLITGGQLRGTSAISYANERDSLYSDLAADPGSSNLRVGQQFPASVYNTYRTMIAFLIGLINYSVLDSAKLELQGNTDASTTDFNNLVVTAFFYGGTMTTSDWTRFTGWKSSGAYTSIKSLIDTLHSSSYPGAAYVSRKFTSAGLDTIKKFIDSATDTFKIAVISSRDSAGTAPTGDEYIIWESTETPRIILFYRILPVSSFTKIGNYNPIYEGPFQEKNEYGGNYNPILGRARRTR